MTREGCATSFRQMLVVEPASQREVRVVKIGADTATVPGANSVSAHTSASSSALLYSPRRLIPLRRHRT
jgi:hypothetical protein